jgi:hypothetical protein
MPRSFRSPLDGFDSPFGPTRIPGWLSAFAPWASYAYGTTGLTTPQYYNMSLAETRAGEALKLNAAGVYVGIPANTPLILGGAGHDVFGAYTNGVRNPRFEGATVGVIGSGGVLPTNMVVSNRGQSTEIIEIGYEFGLPYIDIRTFGTPTTSGDLLMSFEPDASPVAASEGQIWTTSFWAVLLDAPIPLMSPPRAVTVFRNSSNTAVALETVETSIATFTRGVATGAAPATTAKVQPRFIPMTLVSSVSVDFTVRIYAPQLTLSGFAHPPVLPAVGVPAASTRNASISTVTDQPEIGDFRVKLRPNITDLSNRTFWSRGPDANNKSELAMIDGKIRQTITVGGVAEVAIETSAYSSAPGIVEIEAIAADGNQSISATGRTGATSTTAVTIPAGTIERFGGLGGTTFPNCANMDFAVGPA